MDLGLTDRRAVITGASEGIGRAISHGLAAEGVSIALLARSRERLDGVAEEDSSCRRAWGRRRRPDGCA